MAFNGWPAEALHFFEGLEADNSKAYWEDHKATYLTCVRAPMDELLGELTAEFGTPKVFRPYRDVRFSADKTPYKTAIAASLAGGGYVQLSADGLFVGSGMYHLEPAQLERYRAAVAADATGAQIAAIVEQARTAGLDVAAPEVLKTAPKGYPKDHPRIELLRHKGLVAMRQWPPAGWLGTRKAKDRAVAALRAAGPLNDWLTKNVGAADL
ncbi:MAG: hypothetical protein QOG49_772 [Frankiaceae bacterium]|jgi:uncharacterized protein (TIGR02453 family)|nr:hypothetical protein [Frankiaceae bacterium]